MTRLAVMFLAVCICSLLIPVLAVLFLLVYLEDRASPLLMQERVGKGKTRFFCYKIRTMRVGTVEVASHYASPEGVTKVGGVLRRAGLDELPQILNVIIGNMSFVGPRPCLPSQTELIEMRDAKAVYDVLPGITGLAQIQNVDMSDPARLATIDSEYVRSKSLWLDLKIILATLSGKGVGDAIKPR